VKQKEFIMVKRCAAIVVVGCLLAAGVCADGNRGGYFDIGLGFGGVRYGAALDEAMSDLEDADFDRMQLQLSLLTFGYAVWGDLYVVGTVGGLGDRLSNDEFGWIQVSTVYYGLGARYYPFGQYLQMGLDAGAARQQTRWDVRSDAPDFAQSGDAASEWGYFAQFCLAVDVNPNTGSLSGLFGLSLITSAIEDESIFSWMIFAKLAWR
jgi:hypothetical protein